MKKTLLPFLLLLTIYSNSQNLMKIREVFDFNVNDDFHSKWADNNIPPHAIRLKVLSKYYSINNDTLFYQFLDYSYFSNYVSNPPHLEYTFKNDTITKTYINLDSSLYYYDNFFQYDTLIDTNSCGNLTNGYSYSIGEFEPENWYRFYGKAIGIIRDYHGGGGSSMPSVNSILFYYQKDTIICGVPDMLTFIDKQTSNTQVKFTVYPNPANNKIIISQNENFSQEIIVSILSVIGEQIYVDKFTNQQSIMIDIHNLKNDIYILKLQYENGIEYKKIIKQ